MKEKEGNKEITVFQGRIMQGNRGVVAFTEFEDSVFKGNLIIVYYIIYC